jgi:hypothetical protein
MKKNKGEELNILNAGKALGIGEDHTCADGRNKVLELLTAGVVAHLFIEVRQWGAAFLNQARARGLTNEEAIVKALAGKFGVQFACGTPLERVMARAIHRNVPVHCADGGTASMGSRNSFMATTFKNVTGGNCAGSVLLIGGAHFEEGNPTLQDEIKGMDWIDYPSH